MDTNLAVAIISSAGAVIVGLGALATNAFWIGRAMDILGKRIDSLEHNIALLDQRQENRFALVDQDLKQFYRDIVQIKQKIGLE